VPGAQQTRHSADPSTSATSARPASTYGSIFGSLPFRASRPRARCDAPLPYRARVIIAKTRSVIFLQTTMDDERSACRRRLAGATPRGQAAGEMCGWLTGRTRERPGNLRRVRRTDYPMWAGCAAILCGHGLRRHGRLRCHRSRGPRGTPPARRAHSHAARCPRPVSPRTRRRRRPMLYRDAARCVGSDVGPSIAVHAQAVGPVDTS